MSNLNRERLGLLQVFIPELFHEPGTVLYIGAYNRRFWGSGALYQAGNEITVVEIWEPFIEGLKASRFSKRAAHIVQGNVCDLPELPHEQYDYALWFHGPEHVTKPDFQKARKQLEARARCVVMTCPWGRFVHGVAYDNPYTEHKGHYNPSDFIKHRYRIACIGRPDHPGSQLQAWRWLQR